MTVGVETRSRTPAPGPGALCPAVTPSRARALLPAAWPSRRRPGVLVLAHGGWGQRGCGRVAASRRACVPRRASVMLQAGAQQHCESDAEAEREVWTRLPRSLRPPVGRPPCLRLHLARRTSHPWSVVSALRELIIYTQAQNQRGREAVVESTRFR